MYGPQYLTSQYGIDQLGLQQQQAKINAGIQQGWLTQNAGLDRQSLALQGQGIGMDKSYINQQMGLQGEQYANQLRQLGLDEAQVRDMTQRYLFDLRSSLTARGAFNTIANERGTGNIQRDEQYALGGIANRRSGAGIQNRQAIAGLTNQLNKLGLDSQKLGISQKQLEAGLSQGLEKIGMNAVDTVAQIGNSINSGNIQQAQLGSQILQSALQYSNLPPEMINSIMRMLGLQMPGVSTQTYNPTYNVGGGVRVG